MKEPELEKNKASTSGPEKIPAAAYDSESYSSGSGELSIYQSDDRIFQRQQFGYDFVAKVLSHRFRDSLLEAELELESGLNARMSLQAVSKDILRFRFWKPEENFDDTSVMLTGKAAGIEPARLSENEHSINFRTGGCEFRIDKSPFLLTVLDVSGTEIMQMDDRKVAGSYMTGPIGFRTDGNERSQPFFSWKMRNDEHFFGLGEKFNKCEKSSTCATIWASDTCGTNSNDMSYKSLPLLFSDGGWGIMLHSTFRSFWEIGTFSYIGGSFLSEDSKIDLFFLLSGTVKGLLGLYTELTGRPATPPDWALGTWLSRCQYRSHRELISEMRRMRKEKIPCDVVHLDPLWMKTHYYFSIGVDACDFVRNETGFPDLEDCYRQYADLGFNTCLWVNPYLPEGEPVYAEAVSRGYLLKDLDGGIARLSHGQAVGIIDFSNPEAKEWWKGKIKRELEAGASVVKPDYGDRVPENAMFYNGRTGAEMHNLYLFLYTEACYEAVEEVYGTGMVWRRSGYLGSQRYPGTWSGDVEVSWEGLRCCLRAGLSAGICGEAYWSSDIGGFVGGNPDPELYIRWFQFGMFNSLSRMHGNGQREPWYFGEKAVEVAREYSEKRYRLIPYIKKMGEVAARTGCPIMRHMALEFPDEPNIHTLDDQYMFGDRLLVAPVIKPGRSERTLYLPKGEWVDFDDRNTEFRGPGFVTVEAPLGKMPVLVCKGAELPVYKEAPQNLKGEVPKIVRL